MSDRLNQLVANLEKVLGKRAQSIETALGEVTVVLNADTYFESALLLRDDPLLGFEQLIDLCGVDYLDLHEGSWAGKRFAAVSHLLSLQHNWRLRVRVFAPDDSYPLVASVTPIWNSANWFEREAFDLYGIIFEGHDDLRRILTDYGFIGHPFRKDFPIAGNVEMIYDSELKRVMYQPVTIEPREITPRIVREEQYGDPV
ncbi:NADH-quinone oxidoreductase subunit C [Polynucleobacter sp. QLW-P1DATA-2]|uniref:NADH-quinone oxidoreductase subunit C n=1 Tax=unclassified Polynucleobacter TaxID=2640945 RepID=UPI0008F91D5D|nr:MULTISPECIES: NADH-quinone oxidoreductase subunit C [unclassified Polynucleobacter]OIM97828.1 NADH-quinone oxidoreductase subunit C [Polynucleobacter sp. QLW-P1DATA-2]OIM98853.1 NADH-quinone oxidoreductase subunit C [Polynucleobacter sp. MWH-Tro8-2-5-gr]